MSTVSIKQIRNLRDEALQASGLTLDHRFQSWVKFVDRVEQSKTDGYAFIGDLVMAGSIEVETGRPCVLLVMARSGSAKYNNAYYRVLVLTTSGEIERTVIEADDKTPGWALRIRDQVAALVAELSGQTVNPLATVPTADLRAELARRGEIE